MGGGAPYPRFMVFRGPPVAWYGKKRGQKEASWAGLMKTSAGKRRSSSPAQTPGLLTDLLTLLASTGNADYKVGEQKLASEAEI